MLVSPPLKTIPKVKLGGKSIAVSWKDTLRENTTYTFLFGDNIQDITEGNTLNNFQFVFSTGSVIDTLAYSGKVLDASTGKALENISVMLYKEFFDSVSSKQKPYYLAKTNKDGAFQFNYLKEGQYKIFALKDENYNLMFDLPNEKVGFSDTLISVGKIYKPITLQLFENFQNKKQQIKSVKRLDAISYLIQFEKNIQSLKCTTDNNYNDFISVVKNDSLQIYFRKKITTDSLALHIYQQSPFFSVGEDKDEVGNKRLLKNNFDTILKIETTTDSINWKRTRLNAMANFQIKSTSAKADELKGRQSSLTNPSNKEVVKLADELNFNQPMYLIFNHPIAKENLKNIFHLIEDTGKFKTTVKPQLLNDSAFQQKVKINYNFKEDHLYELIGRKKSTY